MVPLYAALLLRTCRTISFSILPLREGHRPQVMRYCLFLRYYRNKIRPYKTTCQPEGKIPIRVRRAVVVQVERTPIRVRAAIRIERVAAVQILVVAKRPGKNRCPNNQLIWSLRFYPSSNHTSDFVNMLHPYMPAIYRYVSLLI